MSSSTSQINLDQKLEYKGYWYLPSNPIVKVAGTLIYFPNEKISLELFGSFKEDLSYVLKNMEEPIIHGTTSDAKDITLIQCFQNANINFSAEFPLVNYTCQYLIIGKHIQSPEEKCFNKAHIRIPELSCWCSPDCIKTSYLNDKTDLSFSHLSINVDVASDSAEKFISEVSTDHNTNIRIKQSVGCAHMSYNQKIVLEQYTYIEITKNNAVSIKNMFNDIYRYEQFLSLATLNIVMCSEITLYDDCTYQEFDGHKLYTPISVIHPFSERQSLVNNQKSHEYLFTYKTIKEFYPRILQNWYNAEEDLTPIRRHLIDSLKRKRSYSSIDFLIIIHAIEGYWNRFKDKPYIEKHRDSSTKKPQNTSLKTLLIELKREFDNVETIHQIEIDFDAVVDSRHYYSHFMPPTKRPKKLEGWPLFEITRKLQLLLVCCVLSFVGFEKSQIDSIFRNSNSKLLS